MLPYKVVKGRNGYWFVVTAGTAEQLVAWFRSRAEAIFEADRLNAAGHAR